MKRVLLLSVEVLVALAALTQTASTCGDPPAQGVADPKAQLVIEGREGNVRIGEPIFASVILPRDSQLPVGTLTRASCTSFEFKIEPSTGWHDPWSNWYYSGIPQHATGRDGPRTCGVVGHLSGSEMPPPQINFTLNDWVEFDSPGKYKISVTYRTEFRKPQDILDDPYDDRKTAVQVTLTTDTVEVEVLPESASVVGRTSDAITLLRRHFRDDDPRSGSSDSVGFPEWAQYSHSEAVIPLLAQFYEQDFNAARRGLITSSHRKLVVQEMEKELVNPRHSVGFDFPAELAFIAAEVQHPEMFGADTDDYWTPEWERASEERDKTFLHLLSEYTRKLLLAVPHKNAGPQRDSLEAAIRILVRWDLPEKTKLRELAATEAGSLFPKMKEEPNLTDGEWKLIATPALLPYLRETKLYAEQIRWFSRLAPREARRRMIRSATLNDWGMVAGWADVLPKDERTSVVLDSHLAKALREESDDIVRESYLNRILLRLGGGDLVVPAQQILASESCMGDSALWAFLLKHQGQIAGKSLLRRYQQDRKDPTCDADLPFQQIWLSYPVRYWSPQIEAIVVSELDKNESLSIGAAHLLERLGSEDSQDALWTKLEKWHRSHPLRSREVQASISYENDLEAALLSALLDGRNWSPGPAMLDRLRHLCVYRCDELKWERSTDQVQRLVISDWNQGDIGFINVSRPVAFDDFEQWIQRFPVGSRFAITLSPGNAPLNSAQLNVRYPEVGELMHRLNLEIVDTLPYDEYGRCKDSHSGKIMEHR